MVSTRKLKKFLIKDDCIICECGTPVKSLCLAAVEEGIKGFEGMIDLPGTVGAALYGNAGCYGCSLSGLLEKATILCSDGHVVDVTPQWFDFSNRSSVLKRAEISAIVIKAQFRRVNGDLEEIKQTANNNHLNRKTTQPEAKNSLGSIFANSGQATILNKMLRLITKLYGICFHILGYDHVTVEEKRKKLLFLLLNARDVEPYIRTWNWYQWKDAQSYELFWKFVKLHKIMFTNSIFEIEIKK